MKRDKNKDDKYFQCNLEHEHKNIYDLYTGGEDFVKKLLNSECRKGTICNLTHLEIYELIEYELGLTVPE